MKLPRIDIKRSQMAPSGHAACWYRRKEYERLKTIMDDAATAPPTFEEWEKRAKHQLNQAAAKLGHPIQVVILEPDEFLAFCQKHELKGRGSLERMLYAIAKAAGRLEDDFKIAM
jgi:hypothetical protein